MPPKRLHCSSPGIITTNTGVSTTHQRDWSKWISATATRNYLIKDPLLDYLQNHSSTISFRMPELAGKMVKATSPKSGNFIEFIMAQGREFESKVMEYMYRKHGKEIIIDIGGDTDARSVEKVAATLRAMNKGIPIIHSGVLHNEDNQTYGIPDLLVRSDWLKDIVSVSPISKEEETISAPNLIDPMTNKVPKYHYRVIDIKFTTLYLRADAVHILNSGSFPAYKGQLYIYNDALGRMQGYEPPAAYILGRKWTYTSKGDTYKGVSCMERLGTIDYTDVDHEFIEQTYKAISWVRDVRENGHEWSILKLPFPKTELYPNMSNTHDYPWHDVKSAIADRIKEITQLWMCGVKNREIAHSKGILSWTDSGCSAAAVGVTGPVTKKILDKIIDVNRNTNTTLIMPDKLTSDNTAWLTTPKLEFYVDFEYMNDVFCDFSKMPVVDSQSIIFMIGVRYIVFDETGEPLVRAKSTFKVDDLTLAEERRICEAFSDYIRAECRYYKCKDAPIVHYSNAEVWQWSNAYDRHNGLERIWIPTLEQNDVVSPKWRDLLQLIKGEPIVVRGAMGFSIKEIANALSSHNLISSSYNKIDGSVADGTAAMMSVYLANKEAKRRGVPLGEMPQIVDIVKYNEVDCEAMAEILMLLRKKYKGVK